MATNNFLPFCPTDTGTNLPTQANYAVSTTRTTGAQPGIASSQYNNKPLRQATAVTSQVAQVISDKTGVDLFDDGTTATLYGGINSVYTRLNPVIQNFTSSSGTWNKTYNFFIASGSATAGATYTNNAITFTVIETVASGTFVQGRGSAAPSASGTLTKSAGTGDATLTFYAVRAPLYLRVDMVGAGGGGAGSGSATGTAATAGTASTFGSSLLSAGGGSFGIWAGAAGAGGTSSLGTGPVGLALGGGRGGSAQETSGTNPGLLNGGTGGNSFYGGGGAGGGANGTGFTAGSAGVTNTGAGGGGAGTNNTINVWAGAGGGAGGYVGAMIYSPAVTYAYVVGAGGTAGGAGTSGFAGSAGAAGMISVIEFYQ